MNELVRLSTQDVSRAIPVTDSFIVSEKFGVSHKAVTNIIRKYKNDFEIFGKLEHFKNAYETKKETMTFILNEEQFYLLVTYMKNTDIARKYKIEFVKMFSFMKKELQARQNTRHIGVSVRKELSEVIKNCVTDEGKFKSFAYSNYTRLIYKKIFGKDTKKIKEELGLTKNDNLRDYLTIEQLKLVQDLESKIASYIEFTDSANKTDKETYEDIKNIVESNIKQFID